MDGLLPYEDHIDFETKDHRRIMQSTDIAEAFRAFVEKRSATYHGR